MSTGRESTTARGYGTRHQKTRAKFARQLKQAGEVPCARCLLPIFASWPLSPPSVHVPKCKVPTCEGQCWTTWDAGHTDDRDGYNGLEHSACNRAAGGANAQRARTARPSPVPNVDYGW